MKTVHNRTTATQKQTTGENGFLSLGIHMTGRQCLIAGGGQIGTRKALTLLEAGAEVIVVSPWLSKTLQGLAETGRIVWRQRNYQPDDLEGIFLAVAATSDALLNSCIGFEAESRGILCCVVSSAAESAVLFPAVYTKEEVTVAVHSNGRNCRHSQQIRDALKERLSHSKKATGLCSDFSTPDGEVRE